MDDYFAPGLIFGLLISCGVAALVIVTEPPRWDAKQLLECRDEPEWCAKQHPKRFEAVQALTDAARLKGAAE